MGDYYHTTATIQVPSPGQKPRAQHPVRPAYEGAVTVAPSAPREEPSPIQRQPQRPPHARLDEPPNEEPLKPAPVNPTLRQRCHGCETISRRLLPLLLLFFYSLLGGAVFHWTEKDQPQRVDVVKYVETTRTEPIVERRPIYDQSMVDLPEARRPFQQLNERFREIVLDANFTRWRREEEIRTALLWYLGQLDDSLKNRSVATQYVQTRDAIPVETRTVVVQQENQWDFVSSLFYAISIYTTIGYGYPSPTTTAGQILTVFYALIGIPLAMVALMQLAFVLAGGFWKLWSCIRHGRSKRTRGSEWQPIPSTDLETRLREERDDLDALTFPLSALIGLLIVWILITAAWFYAWENPRWSYGESLYFVFISLSTIGLGDYKPLSGWGKIMGAIFLIVGLTLLLTVLAMFLYQMDALYRMLERSIEAEYREALTDTGESMAGTKLATDDALKRMASRLPFASRCLYWLMPESRKRSLRRLYEFKSELANRGMQTDDYLWAMSPSGLKTIGEEGRQPGSPLDDTKSRDDVNSLVAMCDYSLRGPQYRGTKLEY